MVDPVLNLIPGSEVWHLGVYRDEATATPVEYYSRFQQTSPVDVALVLDPMLATGGSAVAALATLKEWGVPQVKVLAVIAVARDRRSVRAIPRYANLRVRDRSGTERQEVHRAGLGDAGDRIFNTPPGEC